MTLIFISGYTGKDIDLCATRAEEGEEEDSLARYMSFVE